MLVTAFAQLGISFISFLVSLSATMLLRARSLLYGHINIPSASNGHA